MKEPRKQYRKEKGIPEPKNVMDSFSTHAEDKAYIEWLESQLTTPTIMSRHREASEKIREHLILCGSINGEMPIEVKEEEIGIIESILTAEYGEGDVKEWTEEERAINFSILSKCMLDDRYAHEGVKLTKAEAEGVVKFMNHYYTHLPEDKGEEIGMELCGPSIQEERLIPDSFYMVNEYLSRQRDNGVIEFRVAFQNEYHFIIHPLDKDGDTLDAVIHPEFVADNDNTPPQKQEAPEDMEVEKVIPVSKEGSKIMRGAFEKQEAPLSVENEEQNTPPLTLRDWAELEGVETDGQYLIWLEMYCIELKHQYAQQVAPPKQGMSADEFCKKCDVDPNEKIDTSQDSWWKLKDLLHQYAHRIDPDKLAEEIMAKNVSGFLNRMQSDFEDKVEESIKQTIKEHLK